MVMISIDEAILGTGLIAIGATVFAESGLLIGFFLPGDTLLFGAGLLASQGTFNIWVLIAVVIAAAIVGDNVGYSIGRRAGPRMFKRKDGILFHQDQLQKAEAFYEKHGGKTIILARFVPIVRTFAPVVAGASKMPRERFMLFNVAGAILWGGGVTLAGYWLGQRMPWLENYIDPVIIGIIVISIASALVHLLRDKNTRHALSLKIRSMLSKVALNKKVD